MALYRLQQGLRTLTARARLVDLQTARAYLTPPLMSLFLQMWPSEQQHSLNVLRALRAAGLADPDLMTAALVHDAGKSGVPYHMWDRVLVVLARRFFPRRTHAWGAGEPVGWRRPFVVAAQHAAWSAQMVHAAGGSARAVEIIARHHDRLGPPSSETERLIAALIEADGAN
jgi:hypothetical protein